jgi:hypothetical protein
MESQHSVTDWIANFVIVCVVFFTRLVFGKDQLSWMQLVAFLFLCGITVFIVDKIEVNEPLKLSIMLVISMLIPSIVTGLIKGGKESEGNIKTAVKNKITKIFTKNDTEQGSI